MKYLITLALFLGTTQAFAQALPDRQAEHEKAGKEWKHYNYRIN